jgi:hypothetical protein
LNTSAATANAHPGPGKEIPMSNEATTKTLRVRTLSLDSWAVLTAFLLAALVRLGLLKSIPW